MPWKKKSGLSLSGPDLAFDICGALTSDAPEWLSMTDAAYLLVRSNAVELLEWFSESATPSTYLKFSPTLSKQDRAFIHDLVASTMSSDLETYSSGVGDERLISVYLKGHVPKSSTPAHTEEQVQEAVQLWKAARDIGQGKFSRDEILEQLATGCLVAPLQKILEEITGSREGVKKLVAAATSGSVSEIEEICAANPGLAVVCHPDLETGDLPLHAAARGGMLGALKVLVAAGAKVEAVDARGRTPLQVAQSFDQCDAEAVLLQLGAKDPDAASFPLVGAAINMGPKS